MKSILVFFCFSFIGTSFGQQPYYWNLTDDEGLGSNTIYDLHQDEQGYLWLGTSNGLKRYNGSQFFLFRGESQISNDISGLVEDPEHTIWCSNFSNQIFKVSEDSLVEFELHPSILEAVKGFFAI
ncbi:MAG: ligand-binding sensor domain-containing protein [Arenicella sp.]|jgi:ligand-binding sensor domain-containing protein